MPYTLSHPAVALPLAVVGVPTAGLVIGSMTPDLPLWAGAVGLGGVMDRVGLTYAFTHSLAGVLTVTPLIGMALWMLWRAARAPLHDALPAGVRRRHPRPRGLLPSGEGPVGALRWVAGLLLGLVLGAASHVLIDAFSHHAGWGPRHVPWFAAEHAGLAGVKWVQYVGSLGGGLVVLGAAAWMLWRPGRVVSPADQGDDSASARWMVRAGAGLGALGAVAWAVAALATGSLGEAVFQSVTTGVLLVVAGTLVGCLAWHLAMRGGGHAR